MPRTPLANQIAALLIVSPVACHCFGNARLLDWIQLVEVTDKQDGQATKREGVCSDLLQEHAQQRNDAGANSEDPINKKTHRLSVLMLSAMTLASLRSKANEPEPSAESKI